MSDQKTNKNLDHFSLGIYHFNIQYAAGLPSSYFKQTTASFEPFLRFHEKFPKWKSDLEISGHHIAFLERHFPEYLERLHILNKRGQVEIVTVHYSDQIYLAYPGYDLIKSIEIADEILERNGLKRSPVWFGQENFFGEGIAETMKQCGYSVACINGAYYAHLHKSPPPAAYYTYNGIDCLLKGQGRVEGEMVQSWNFWGDGELAFARFNVYFPGYGPSEKKFVKRANQYFQNYQKGVKYITITEYVDIVKKRGYKPVPLEPLLDGSWNLYYYGGVYLWMGTYRFPFERDGYIRSLTIQSRNRVLLAERLVESLATGTTDLEKLRAVVKRAWKHQLLAEVSDSTGQTPFRIEVKYSRAEAAKAMEFAERAITTIRDKKALGGQWVDLGKGTIQPTPQATISSVLHDIEALPVVSYSNYLQATRLPISARDVKRSSFNATFREVSKNHYIVDFSFRRGKYVPIISRILSIARTNKHPYRSEIVAERINTRSGIYVPLLIDHLAYSPAGLENQLTTYPLVSFAWGHNGEMWLPCPNGVIQVGSDLFLIKHNAHGNTHMAFTVDGRNKRVGLVTLNPPRIKFNWRLSVFRGTPKEALALGNAINVNPEIQL